LAEDEDAYPAFNKTIHACSDKSKGLIIEERGEGLIKTVSTIRWCVRELEGNQDKKTADSVKL